MDEAEKTEDSEATNVLSGKTAVVVTHIRGFGPSHYLEEFLAQRCHSVLSICHPLIYESNARPQYRLFKDGVVVENGEREIRGPEVLIRLQEVFLTIFWVRRFAAKSDYYFGVDALNAITGIFLRTIRSTAKVIYYTIDWSPKRFDVNFLNGLYHFSDRSAALGANETWNVSPEIDHGRWRGEIWEFIGRNAKKRTKIVEIGVAKVESTTKENLGVPSRLVFLGHLLEKQGLQLAIEALPEIANSFDDVELVVIGDGPFQNDLKVIAQRHGVSERVSFLGYVDSEVEVFKILSSSAIGLAPYLETEDSFTRFADPGKLKNYLAAGLPIVVTRVPHNAEYLESLGCAIVVDASAASVGDAVCRLLSESTDERENRRAKALSTMRGLDWTSIFSRAIGPLRT